MALELTLGPMTTPAPRCRTHHQPAGWRCTACRSPLCPECAAIQKRAHVELLVCGLCGELANPLTRHRADEASYLQRLPAALVWPATQDALISWIAVTAFFALFSAFPGLGRVVASLGLYAASYAIIRMTASNQPEFFVETSGWWDLGWPVFKSGLIYLLLLAAAAVYIVYFKKSSGVMGYLLDPVLWLLAIAAFVLGPMTTLMAACHTSFGQMLNPVLVVAYIGKIGADYWLALVSLAMVGALGGLLGLLTKPLNLLPVPFLATLVGAAVEVYFAFVSARILGLLLYVRGDRVGYGPASDYETPLLGAVQPRGKLPEKAAREVDASIPEVAVPGLVEPAAAPRSHAPIEFDESSAGPMELMQPGEVSPVRALDADALPSAAELFARNIRDAAARGDWATAVDAWRASPDKAALGLDAEHLTGLGRSAASQGDNALAREALELAAQGDAAQLSCARAKVFLARLLAERFNEPARAQALFREVLTRAPGTDAAQFAQKMLRP